jgi:glutamate/tyrosine decarboxylase-like PLP-dependent enzyme
LKQLDVKPESGKTFAYAYPRQKEFEEFITKAHNKFINSNALNPFVYVSLRKMENDIVRMTASLFNGGNINFFNKRQKYTWKFNKWRNRIIINGRKNCKRMGKRN